MLFHKAVKDLVKPNTVLRSLQLQLPSLCYFQNFLATLCFHVCKSFPHLRNSVTISFLTRQQTELSCKAQTRLKHIDGVCHLINCGCQYFQSMWRGRITFPSLLRRLIHYCLQIWALQLQEKKFFFYSLLLQITCTVFLAS